MPTRPNGWRCGPAWCPRPPPRPGAGWRCPAWWSRPSAPGSLPASPQGTRPRAEVAADLGLDPLPTRLLLDCLRSAGHVAERSGRYRLTRRGRRWLDPASRLSVAAYVAGAARLLVLVGRAARGRADRRTSSGSHERAARRPVLAALHGAASASWPGCRPPRWRESCRCRAGRAPCSTSAAATAGTPRALCRRYPELTATVLDLPGSAAVGREVIAAAGPGGPGAVPRRRRDVGGPRRRATTRCSCFNLVHHLGPEPDRRPVPPGPQGTQARRHAGRAGRLRRPRPPRAGPRRHARPVRLPQLGRPGAHPGANWPAGCAPRASPRRGRSGCCACPGSPSRSPGIQDDPLTEGQLLLAPGAGPVRPGGAVRSPYRPGRRAVHRADRSRASGRGARRSRVGRRGGGLRGRRR